MQLVRPFFAAANFIKSLVLLFVTHLPGGPGNKMRYYYYRRKLNRCGKNVIIDTGTVLEGCSFISIGDNVHIDKNCLLSTAGRLQGKIFEHAHKEWQISKPNIVIGNNVHLVQNCIIMGYGGVRIGDNCTMSACSKIYSLSNLPKDPDNPSQVVSIMPYDQAPFILSPVVLEQNVWLGINCIVMPGTRISKNSFAVSNSLLLGEYEENAHLAGQPAVKVKQRYQIQQ